MNMSILNISNRLSQLFVSKQHPLKITIRNSTDLLSAPVIRKFPKAHRTKIGLRIGGSTRGNWVKHLEYGIRVKEPVRLKASVLQACENTLKRMIKPLKSASIILRQQPNFPYTKKPLNSKMGKGKGPVSYYAARVCKDKIVFELGGEDVTRELAQKAMKQINYLMPCKTEFVVKSEQPKEILKLLEEKEIEKQKSLEAQSQAAI